MDTMTAFIRASAAAGREQMVFDWIKAAKLIHERKPELVQAGLQGDWEWTGGTIFKDGKPVLDSYTFLASNHAAPEIDLDGDRMPCYCMQSAQPTFGSETKWPAEALAIIE
jgi:hypothetical protein